MTTFFSPLSKGKKPAARKRFFPPELKEMAAYAAELKGADKVMADLNITKSVLARWQREHDVAGGLEEYSQTWILEEYDRLRKQLDRLGEMMSFV